MSIQTNVEIIKAEDFSQYFPSFADWMKVNYPCEWMAFNVKNQELQSFYGPMTYEMATYSIMETYKFNGRFKSEYLREKELFERTHQHKEFPSLESVPEHYSIGAGQRSPKKRKFCVQEEVELYDDDSKVEDVN